jgi:LuxR family maltose regulon positive regulatory protein
MHAALDADHPNSGSRVQPSPAQRAKGAASDLLLKVTAPRVPRDLLVRARLCADDAQFRGRPVVVVQAPAGFGKTWLLAQWRREHLAQGAVVAWLTAQAEDNPQRLVSGLALSVRVGSGRPTFGHTLVEGTVPPGLEGATAWLAEVAQSALDVVLFVDDAERLPERGREALTYVLHNAPANLRAVVAARPDCDLGVADLVPYGQCAVVGASMLRFTLDEAIAFAQEHAALPIDADTCARLHEHTEGWPLGLRLAFAMLARGTDARAAINSMVARSGELHDHLVALLVANLDPDDTAFLTRVSIVDRLHPDLCRALTGQEDACERLARLSRETPILIGTEDSDWLRMHTMARDVLRKRFTGLPAAEQAALRERASHWLADQGMFEGAARLALDAGLHDVAYDLAERCLYEGLMQQGQSDAVLDWLSMLPPDVLDQRPRLLLAAAWALAVSEGHQQAEPLVRRILEHAGNDDAMRCECALILSGAAGYADDPDRFSELHDPWAVSPPLTDPLLLAIHANRRTLRALFAGDPAQARRHQQNAPRVETGRYIGRWGELGTALTYLWEGQVLLTENLLRPALAQAEAEFGRRDPITCMQAALLAAALWERDRPAEAATHLANRLDVLERAGMPEALLLGYRTAARIAAAEGSEPRALELLEALDAVAVARRLPRLRIASLADQVRIHARRFRSETCRALCARIDAIMTAPDTPTGPLWRRSADLLQWHAHAYAAIAAQEWRQALGPLAQAGEIAEAMNLGRVRIELMALRAFVLDRAGERSVALLREAIDLAESYGLARLFVDAHPALGDWAQRVAREAAGGTSGATPAAAAQARPLAGLMPARPRDIPAGPRANPSMALTPKEREVLELLARNLSNKEIALAMQIGEETIKWHLKNLFGKLAAGNRKQVVRRAQLLGLLAEAA